MLWEKFKNEFHESYHSKIRPFIESKECDELYAYLKLRSKMGHKIAPLSSLTWRIFKELPLDQIKVVVMGLDPYNKFINGVSIADGISMSCSVTGKLQPSIDNFYNGIEQELYDGLNLSYYKNPDLLYLVKQGVFLTNSALTTEMGKPGVHIPKWEPFTKYFLENIVGYTGIPILFLGNVASKYQRYVTPFTHTFTVDHPASAAYNGGNWSPEGAIKKINQIIWENNGFKIKWLCDELEIEEILINNEPAPF